MTQENIKKIADAMQENLSSSLLDHVDIFYSLEGEDIESFDDIIHLLEHHGAFDVEVIYYTTAMQFLMAEDCSLNSSLEIAAELGYSVGSLSSEVLASLLASQMYRNEVESMRDEIQELIEQLLEDEAAEEQDSNQE